MNRRLEKLIGNPSQEGDPGAAVTEAADPLVPAPRAVMAAVAGIAAAWIAAGSAGLLARPLQHALSWLGVAVVLTAGGPRRSLQAPQVACLGAGALGAVILTAPAMGVYNVIAVALVLAAVAWTADGADRRALLAAAHAVAALAIYRLALITIPVAWLAFNAAGEALGAGTSAACAKPLAIGASFAGMDFLVLMAALAAAWLMETPSRRLGRALGIAAAIVCGHAVYLMALAHTDDMLAAIPKPPPVEPSLYQSDLYRPPPWHWGDALRTLLPWNLPVLALALHAAIAAAMFRWSQRSADKPPLARRAEQSPKAPLARRAEQSPKPPLARRAGEGQGVRAALGLGAVTLAALIPLVTSLSTVKTDLAGRKIVVYDHGSMDWEKPKFDHFGRDSAGQYGMLPALVKCLGGQLLRAADLSAPLVDQADVLVVIHPTRRWSAGQVQRVWDCVRRGGSLLVVAGPRVHDDGPASSVNELLEPIGMEVRFDTAIPAVRHWEHGLEAVVHPVGVGIDDPSRGLALAEGSSIRLGFSAQPVVIGRWGWSDPGSDAVLTGVSRLEPGERLGDLVLAAEQGVGRGTVIVLADASALKNLGLAGGYEYVARVMGYLAAHGSSPQLGWRPILGLMACLGLVCLLGWQPDPGRLAASLAMLALLLSLATNLTAARAKTLVDGRESTPNPVACIDASHLPATSDEPWSDDGLAGFQLTLMRNGYLPIAMRQWSDEQLQRAGVLIAAAPARPFSGAELAAVRRFLEQGGVMLCMAGANHGAPIEPLLKEFGLSVPLSPLRPADPRSEPRPMGFFRTPYLDAGKYKAHVGLYAGWPVATHGEGAEALVRGFDDPPLALDSLPVVASARVGRGRIFLFGDTYFAANKNLELEDGTTPTVVRENAHFWRWFFAELNGPKWVPPEPPPKGGESDDDAGDDAPGQSGKAAADPRAASPKRSTSKEATP